MSQSPTEISTGRNGVDFRPIIFFVFVLSILAGFLVLGGLDAVRKSFKVAPEVEELSGNLQKTEQQVVDEQAVQQWIYRFGAVRCPARLNKTMDYAFEELDLHLGLAFLDIEYNFTDLRQCIDRMRPLVDNCLLEGDNKFSTNKAANIIGLRQRLEEVRHKW